jgi:hypothetical protein
VPNGVDVPERPLDYGERSRTVAMVGNFTYGVEAALREAALG